MTLPVVDVATAAPHALVAMLQQHGAVLVSAPSLPPSRCAAVLRDVEAFFGLPEERKAALAIERSLHFRGYSRMQNERDYREQLHFGHDRGAVADAAPFWRLQGPNRWPDDAQWCERMRAWMLDVQTIGARLLALLASAVDLDHRRWLGGDPYLLTKCIGYHAQPHAASRRRGVAAHLDFSLLTLTLQDDVGGLEVRGRDGAWRPVPTVPGCLLVTVGELLQYVTVDRLVATPHRVVNQSLRRTRCSVPVFVCPSLDTTLHTELPRAPSGPAAAGIDHEHVHAVLDPASPPVSLHFGEAEWRRKGENAWCRVCAPPGHDSPRAVRDHARDASMLERRCR